MQNQEPATISNLYPDFSEAELEEGEANLRRYLAVLLRIAERLEAEGRSIADLAVDCPFDDNAPQR